MNNIDTLQIYNDLKAAGVSEEASQAQAKAIAHANKVTPEDLASLEKSILNRLNDVIIEMKWMKAVGAVMTAAFLSVWFK